MFVISCTDALLQKGSKTRFITTSFGEDSVSFTSSDLAGGLGP